MAVVDEPLPGAPIPAAPGVAEPAADLAVVDAPVPAAPTRADMPDPDPGAAIDLAPDAEAERGDAPEPVAAPVVAPAAPDSLFEAGAADVAITPPPAVTAEDRALLVHAAGREPLSLSWVVGTLGVGAAEAGSLLQSMVDDGLLRRSGEDRAARYVLPDHAGPVPAEPDGPHPPDLPELFDAEMQLLHDRALREAGYRDGTHRGLLAEHGGLATARRLLATRSVGPAFTVLWERRRLDLTVEALVLQPHFASLFGRADLDTARQRLAAYGYDPARRTSQ